MRAFIELAAKGNRRLIVETAAIVGVLTPERGLKDDVGTPERPVTVIIRNAAPVDVVGIAATMVLGSVCMVAEKIDKLKDQERDFPPIVVQWLDMDEADG